MGLFNRNRKKYVEADLNKVAVACSEEATTPAEPPVEVAEPQENWIWVEGYKGTDKDMKAHGDFQYELGKQYDYEGEIEICNQGFHFCRDLQDVFSYYDVKNSHRFFKVKALVKESDYNKYGEYRTLEEPYRTWVSAVMNNARVDKLVAKSIILEEEVSKTDIIMTYCQNTLSRQIPEKYWDTMIHNGYPAAHKNWKVDKLIKAGYSHTFAECIYKDDKVTKALAIADQEGVSMDMKVWYIYH